MTLKKRQIKRTTIYCLFLVLIQISCKKTDQHSIEIYLLKERINSPDGISIDRLKSYPGIDAMALKSIPSTVRYDTVQKEFINAGSFKVKPNQIGAAPLIIDAEILGLDTNKSEIELSANAVNKIVGLKPSMTDGIQFVICDNKKPLFTGYFWSGFSSYGSHWNVIEYNHTKKATDKTKLKMYREQGIDASKREKTNFSEYHGLVNAFQKRGNK